ncbi:hypothetical protein HZA96_00055 [Candidatus Woesearchaeota archaeon]|nr:hypothetical protein [Candidatus Woesearchaeota archaeon]
MASKDVHRRHIKEHTQEIKDAIAMGIEERPATIGFHTSACSIDLLEIYLHNLGKLPTGSVIKHEWFKKPQEGQKSLPVAERRLGIDFPEKSRLLTLMYQIESERNKLIYGNPTKSAIESAIKAYQELQSVIKEKLKELGEQIE